MEQNDCGACGTPKRVNHHGKLDCHHCYPENFFGFTTEKLVVRVEGSGDIVDHPVFQDKGVEVLEESDVE